MRTRRIIAIVLAFVSLPAVVLGLIDPLEGGIALLVGIALIGAVWALSRVAPPKLLWISLVATVALGAITLGLAMVSGPETEAGTVGNPVLDQPLVSLLWLWRAGIVVVLAGGIVYLVRLFRSLREPADAATERVP
ncbi:hypothetical protein ACFPER_06040 [Agromyces aurantiacus]|uniref:Uncharacterized protein n=1 Tax=Agromyces aurantiacus TaxID=165814 RepID=A0ABV9R3E2_9MICO|nr:hypothetical protein [Agromyces aurantiacus]MBM7503022.1 hypothetical protein [Agromyces aurantiacus]